jgi:hypothetical protein
MRLLVVIPHYFGPSHPDNNLPAIGSYIEPLGRIAALNETVVALHRHFGPDRHFYDGTPIPADAHGPERRLDIVIVAIRGYELVDELGFAPGTVEVDYVDCKPPWIAFEAQRVFRERLGRYDFYCFMEDDLVIHDPAFFDKLAWFQGSFGPKTLLMPVRCEIPATGNPAKVIIDLDLAAEWYLPFRRPGQAEELEGAWNGRAQVFELPKNPHSGSFFLAAEQMDRWVRQPSYDDRDASWTGPFESAGTLSVGKVFDLYKPVRPDPFFLEIQHFGVRYSAQSPLEGRRYGEPPLLAIAQNALRAALGHGEAASADAANGSVDPAFARLVRRWLAQGTAVELRGQMDALQVQMARQKHESEVRLARQADDLRQRHDQLAGQVAKAEDWARDLERHSDALTAQVVDLDQQLTHERHGQDVHARSIRWLLGSLRAEILRRLRLGKAG